MTSPPIDPADHLEIVQRLTRIETQVENLTEVVQSWQFRHEKENDGVHTTVEKHTKRIDALESWKKSAMLAASAVGAVLTTAGAALATKAEPIITLLFGTKLP